MDKCNVNVDMEGSMWDLIPRNHYSYFMLVCIFRNGISFIGAFCLGVQRVNKKLRWGKAKVTQIAKLHLHTSIHPPLVSVPALQLCELNYLYPSLCSGDNTNLADENISTDTFQGGMSFKLEMSPATC